jgi:adenosylcobinamide kinase/adenosylcobinamide-phosphate guanylyltransferase
VTLVVYVGGARSGKSGLALQRAHEAAAPVVFIATGEAGDDEMAERIERHRADRPAAWRTVEEPLELEAALGRIPDGTTAIVDCLSLWVANLGEGEDVEARSAAAVRVATARRGLTIAVTNEVGLGIVPDNPLARGYRDTLGRVNAEWAAVADEAYFVVAGRPLRLA